jgi:hypothetical protein
MGFEIFIYIPRWVTKQFVIYLQPTLAVTLWLVPKSEIYDCIISHEFLSGVVQGAIFLLKPIKVHWETLQAKTQNLYLDHLYLAH